VDGLGKTPGNEGGKLKEYKGNRTKGDIRPRTGRKGKGGQERFEVCSIKRGGW